MKLMMAVADYECIIESLRSQIPVWHDAVKDPPKEEGNFLALIVIENSPPYITIEHNSLGCKLHSYIKYWMPLPLPPERSGE
jgi:hypothetical protein